MIKISVITVTWNVEATIADTIESVALQQYPCLEYIIIDGGSTDATLDIIKQYKDKIHKIISEPDKGIYDAINKGIKYASGDVIGFLHADDMFANEAIIEKIAKEFNEDKVLEAVIGDIVFVKRNDTASILRNYSSMKWSPTKFAWGYMPPHPSFFCKRSTYMALGLYKINYKIAADYELLIRFLYAQKIYYKYVPIITTKMRLGGVSTRGFKSLLLLNKEIKRACEENKVYTNYFMIYSKYAFKIFEFVNNPAYKKFGK